MLNKLTPLIKARFAELQAQVLRLTKSEARLKRANVRLTQRVAYLLDAAKQADASRLLNEEANKVAIRMMQRQLELAPIEIDSLTRKLEFATLATSQVRVVQKVDPAHDGHIRVRVMYDVTKDVLCIEHRYNTPDGKQVGHAYNLPCRDLTYGWHDVGHYAIPGMLTGVPK